MSSELKRLQNQISETDKELARLQQNVNALNRSISQLRRLKNSFVDRVNDLTRREIIVSEHAMLRYLQRRDGLDLEGLSQLILNPVKKEVERYGSGKFPHPDGFKLIVKNRIVVTIVTKD